MNSDGKPHGFGFYLYNEDMDVWYLGMFENGQRHGYGWMKFWNETTYQGEFSKDMIHGKGCMIQKRICDCDGRVHSHES